jgi:hypothetical protein
MFFFCVTIFPEKAESKNKQNGNQNNIFIDD